MEQKINDLISKTFTDELRSKSCVFGVSDGFLPLDGIQDSPFLTRLDEVDFLRFCYAIFTRVAKLHQHIPHGNLIPANLRYNFVSGEISLILEARLPSLKDKDNIPSYHKKNNQYLTIMPPELNAEILHYKHRVKPTKEMDLYALGIHLKKLLDNYYKKNDITPIRSLLFAISYMLTLKNPKERISLDIARIAILCNLLLALNEKNYDTINKDIHNVYANIIDLDDGNIDWKEIRNKFVTEGNFCSHSIKTRLTEKSPIIYVREKVSESWSKILDQCDNEILERKKTILTQYNNQHKPKDVRGIPHEMAVRREAKEQVSSNCVIM